jgi:septum formation protein
VLASASPRRRELLRLMGLPFVVRVPNVDEEPRRGERPSRYARRLALAKARQIAAQLPPSGPACVIGCDTIVVVDGQILGKPQTAEDATRMLQGLSGRTHRVLSGLAVLVRRTTGGWRTYSRVVATRVTFRSLDPEEIRAYVRSGEPMDKAGAYGIQEGAAHFVRRVVGSYTNVVGLPLAELAELLRRVLPRGRSSQGEGSETTRKFPHSSLGK